MKYNVLVFSLCSFPTFYLLNSLVQKFLSAHPVGYRGVSPSVGYRGVSLSVGYRGFSLFVQNAFKVQPRRTVYHIQVFEAYQTEGNFCHELLISFFVMLFILTRSSTYPNPSFSTQLIWIIHYLA